MLFNLKKEENSDMCYMLLLLLSRFSRVRLCATPETAAHQAPLSLGFSRQEHCSGLPFPSPTHQSEKWKWSRSVVSDLATPWTAAYQAPLSMGFSKQEYWSGVPLPSPHVLYREGWTLKTLCSVKKTVTKGQVLYDSTHVKYRGVKFIEAESRMVVISSWRKGRRGGYCLTGTEFQFHKMKRILETGCPTLWMYLMSPTIYLYKWLKQ